MGLLDKLISGVNRVHDVATDVEYKLLEDRRYGQADRLAAEGVRNEGVLTGIKRRYNDGTTDTSARVSWFGPDERHSGVLLGTGHMEGLRLGATVAIRTDGADAVLDWETMSAAWGQPASSSQRRARGAPDAGIDDTALDMRVLSRLKKWTPGRGTIESYQRCTVFGMIVDNWDVVLRCSDGSRRTMPKDEIPFYTRWYAYPGSDVPVVLDPKDPGRVQVDWRLVAVERAVAGGRWQEPAPPGSVAFDILSVAPPPAPSAMGATPSGSMSSAPMSFEPAPEGLVPIEGIDLQRWAAIDTAITAARIPPAQYDAYAAEHLGVPPGRWRAIDAAWRDRAKQDWRVGAKQGEAISAAQKAAKAAKRKR